MSSLYAFDFIFDGIPSHKFDLKIITFEDGGVFSGVGSSDVEILTQRIFRKSKPYYLGRILQPVLEFPLTFGTAYPISAMDRDLISAWLFGRSGYKKLEILQDDFNGAYFNCFLTKPEPIYIGNLNYAFKCTVVCDSPFAYSYPKSITINHDKMGYMYPLGQSYYYNYSSDEDYIYPTFTFTTKDTVTSYTISSYTSGSSGAVLLSASYFNNLEPYTTVTVDNDLQIITASILYPFSPYPFSTNVLSKFNKQWLKLAPGNGLLESYGNVDSATVTYTERLKIGG